MTQRKTIKRELISELVSNKAKVALQKAGRVFTMSDGTRIVYTPIEPKTVGMYELIEGVARRLGGDIWNWYLSASDKQIDKLASEANREA